jgi:23S rRNA (cytosine1962-C5)-methyltransferase
MTEPLDSPAQRPHVRLLPGRSRRVRSGHPWVYSNEIVMDAGAKALPPGGLVTVIDAGDEALGVGTFNPLSLISVRLLSRDAAATIGPDFIGGRLNSALSLRRTLFTRPFYRLVHAEADGLPGLVVDRYGDVLAVQANSAGMDRLLPLVIAALDALLAPVAIVLQNESPVRKLEGLPLDHRMAKGALEAPVLLEENGCRFFADLATGQKTGWFYDQRDTRAVVAGLGAGRKMIDFYSYAGGFAVQAARAGASEVIAVDRSDASLALAARAAEANDVTVQTVRAECFAEMDRLAAAGRRFGVVVADPPAFVKSKKDLAAGAKGYRKMARLAALLVEPQGFLLAGSCSYHMSAEAFAEEVRHGLAQAGRSGRILRAAGAGADHPVHPFLPESAYLKTLLLQLD